MIDFYSESSDEEEEEEEEATARSENDLNVVALHSSVGLFPEDGLQHHCNRLRWFRQLAVTVVAASLSRSPVFLTAVFQLQRYFLTVTCTNTHQQ